jgi:hypothetical protein
MKPTLEVQKRFPTINPMEWLRRDRPARAGNGIARWLENAESGSGVEKALYRLMKLLGGEVLYRRSPRETRPALTGLINNSNRQVNTSQNSAALYSLRAMLQYRPGASIPPGSMLSLI